MSPNKGGGAKPNRAASMGGGGAAASEASVSSTDESNAASAAAAAKVHAAPMCPHVGKAVNIKGVKKTLGVAWYVVRRYVKVESKILYFIYVIHRLKGTRL